MQRHLFTYGCGNIEYEILASKVKRVAVLYSAGVLSFHVPSNEMDNIKDAITSFLRYNYDYFMKKRAIEQNALDSYRKIHGDRICVFGRYIEKDNANVCALSHMLLQCAKSLVSEISHNMGLECPHVDISYTNGYVGKCIARYRIVKIDYRNVLCSIDLLRYVVTHELSHFFHPNHSKAFWKYVDRFYKESKKTTKKLRKQITTNVAILDHYGLLPDSYKVITRFNIATYRI